MFNLAAATRLPVAVSPARTAWSAPAHDPWRCDSPQSWPCVDPTRLSQTHRPQSPRSLAASLPTLLSGSGLRRHDENEPSSPRLSPMLTTTRSPLHRPLLHPIVSRIHPTPRCCSAAVVRSALSAVDPCLRTLRGGFHRLARPFRPGFHAFFRPLSCGCVFAQSTVGVRFGRGQ